MNTQNPNHNTTDLELTDGTTHFVSVPMEQSALPRPSVCASAHAEPREIVRIPKTKKFNFLKVGGAVLLLLLSMGGISQIGSTSSSYSDSESSLNNSLVADPLDFTVTFATTSIDISGGEQLLVPVVTPGADSEPIQYFVQAKTLDGDASLCSQLQVLTTAPFPYDGPLTSLRTATTTDLGSWALTVWLPKTATSTGVSCRVDLVYTAWNANAPWGSGYTDIEHVPFLFYIGASTSSAATSTPAITGQTPTLPGVVEGTSTSNIPDSSTSTTTLDATSTTTSDTSSAVQQPVGGGANPPEQTSPAVNLPTDPVPAADPTPSDPATSTPPTNTPPSTPPSDTPPPAAVPPPTDPTPPPADPTPAPSDPAPVTQ